MSSIKNFRLPWGQIFPKSSILPNIIFFWLSDVVSVLFLVWSPVYSEFRYNFRRKICNIILCKIWDILYVFERSWTHRRHLLQLLLIYYISQFVKPYLFIPNLCHPLFQVKGRITSNCSKINATFILTINKFVPNFHCFLYL